MLLAPWATRAVQEAIDKQSRSNQRAIDLAMPLASRAEQSLPLGQERKTEMPVLIDGLGNMTHIPRKDESADLTVTDLRNHIRELIEVHCDVELKNTLYADIDAYFIENNIDMKTIINR